MKKTFITLILSFFLVVNIGVALPAASASELSSNFYTSTSKKEVNIYPFTPFYGDKVTVSYDDKMPGEFTEVNSPGPFYLQKFVNNKWVNVSKAKTIKTGKTYTISFAKPFTKSGDSMKVRLYHPENSTFSSWVSSEQTLKFKSMKSVFYKQSDALSQLPKKWPTRAKMNFYMYNLSPGYGRTIYVQRYDSKKKKWVNVSKAKTSNEYWGYTKVSAPAPKKSGKAKYRIYAPKTNSYSAVSSKSKTVTFHNPRAYKGYKKKAYNYMKKWCPNVIIEIKKHSGNTLGTAYFNKELIKINPGIRNDVLKYIAVHECAHLIQIKPYKGDYGKLMKESNKLFKEHGSMGLEKLADCMTHYMGAKKKHGYYTQKCSAKQLKGAKRVLSGKKIY